MSEQESSQWRAATWSGAEATRRAADQQLSFRQKIEWNAQALALAKQLKKRSGSATTAAGPSTPAS